MILRCELGKSRLWIGEPLILSTEMEFEPSKDAAPPDSSTESRVWFKNVEDDSEAHQATPLQVNVPPGVLVLETLDISPGAYEVVIERGEETVAIPELIWLLSREDYRALVREEAKEPFGYGPIVSTQTELERLLDSSAASVWPGLQNPFKVSWPYNNVPILYPPLQWTTETILRTLRSVSAFGISELTGFLSVANGRMEIGVDAVFAYPIPDPISQTLYDTECSDVYLMNANNDLGEFEVDIDVRYNRGRIAVRQTIPELAYA